MNAAIRAAVESLVVSAGAAYLLMAAWVAHVAAIAWADRRAYGIGPHHDGRLLRFLVWRVVFWPLVVRRLLRGMP